MRGSHLVPVGVVADALSVSTRTVWRLVEAGTIPTYRVGRSVRFSVDEVVDAVKSGRSDPQEGSPRAA